MVFVISYLDRNFNEYFLLEKPVNYNEEPSYEALDSLARSEFSGYLARFKSIDDIIGFLYANPKKIPKFFIFIPNNFKIDGGEKTFNVYKLGFNLIPENEPQLTLMSKRGNLGIVE